MIKPDYQNNPPLILIVDDEKNLAISAKAGYGEGRISGC
jgi:hypothetical protein